MRINITNAVTVADLRSQLEGAEPGTVLEFFSVAKSKQENSCWCGCGGTTRNRFVPGHDSKFHSLAKQVARGLEPMPTEWVSDEAEADFLKWHDAEVPVHEARQAAKAAKTKAREEAKAEKARLKAELADALKS